MGEEPGVVPKNDSYLVIKTKQSIKDTAVKRKIQFTSEREDNKKHNKGLAPAPPMGWDSWDWFGKNHINERAVK